MSMNRVMIMGRLTRDPELRYTTSNIAYANFALAVERDHSSKEDGSKETDFFDVVAWRNTAEFSSKHLFKGRMVAVDGKLQSLNYTDKDGNKRKSVEIVAERIYFADNKRPDDQNTPGGYKPSEPTNYEEVTGDDSRLPF